MVVKGVNYGARTPPIWYLRNLTILLNTNVSYTLFHHIHILLTTYKPISFREMRTHFTNHLLFHIVVSCCLWTGLRFDTIRHCLKSSFHRKVRLEKGYVVNSETMKPIHATIMSHSALYRFPCID